VEPGLLKFSSEHQPPLESLEAKHPDLMVFLELPSYEPEQCYRELYSSNIREGQIDAYEDRAVSHLNAYNFVIGGKEYTYTQRDPVGLSGEHSLFWKKVIDIKKRITPSGLYSSELAKLTDKLDRDSLYRLFGLSAYAKKHNIGPDQFISHHEHYKQQREKTVISDYFYHNQEKLKRFLAMIEELWQKITEAKLSAHFKYIPYLFSRELDEFVFNKNIIFQKLKQITFAESAEQLAQWIEQEDPNFVQYLNFVIAHLDLSHIDASINYYFADEFTSINDKLTTATALAKDRQQKIEQGELIKLIYATKSQAAVFDSAGNAQQPDGDFGYDQKRRKPTGFQEWYIPPDYLAVDLNEKAVRHRPANITAAQTAALNQLLTEKKMPNEFDLTGESEKK